MYMHVLKTSYQCFQVKLRAESFLFKLPLFERLSHIRSLAMGASNGVDSINTILMPPSSVYGMKKLDRELFRKDIEVPAVEIPNEKLKDSLKQLKPYLLKMMKIPPVQGNEGLKKVLLNPTIFDEMMKKLKLENVFWTKLTLCYENFTSENIFKAVLPPDTGGNVASFSIIGHIIHLNLKPELSDYKSLIGEVLLDKNHTIKTVVNKAQIIDTAYRNFEIELLGGEPSYEVTVKENGFQYAFDFSKVFWNPRLVHEHAEIVKKTEPGDVVFDVFAGVGPFAIPVAKKKCIVHANDLNPHSHQWLCHNAKLNKVSSYLTAYNLDGREFIQTVVRDTIIKLWNEDYKNSIHILMNLPACALDFLDAFRGLLKNHDFSDVDMPIVYCYFFLKKDEEAVDIVKKYFNGNIPENADITSVRLVAPNKRMMRLTYKIPSTVLFESEEFCSKAKRIKLST